MQISFIHNEKKINTGANYINDLVSKKLKEKGVEVKHFYPRARLDDIPTHLAGIKNILFFYSLLEKRGEVLKSDIIQGTTYTPLAFLAFHRPVICHFGSTTHGFLNSTPITKNIGKDLRQFWIRLFKRGIIEEYNLKSRKPMRDIAEIEAHIARKAAAVIAVSNNVRKELLSLDVPQENIFVVHNAIEDFWFKDQPDAHNKPSIVYLGRLGSHIFDFKLKGLDILASVYNAFPSVRKTSIVMTTHKKIFEWFKNSFPNHTAFSNLPKERIKKEIGVLRGSVFLLTSRYEGFSLSLIEGMSQGLVPVAFPVGVVPEIIENGKNGFIVKTHKEMIQATGKLLNNRVLRNYCSRQAKKTALNFTAEKMVKNLLPVYSAICKTNGCSDKKRKKDFSWMWR
ncbi:MAG TPA: glycosyltransferase family 4 protein [Candidatus Paceibacterota bacterium]|nr:glycosyltransferase family 4 protein [Candidatus Pacearchaeota archaeon]HRZ51122.1 glycosyltransferase family 4 protein [Candidatus Paceibacterota bacterium]HSA36871.1 glycosyltransferase family 4 protein [Candidatus Paceibacterota bacterium]